MAHKNRFALLVVLLAAGAADAAQIKSRPITGFNAPMAAGNETRQLAGLTHLTTIPGRAARVHLDAMPSVPLAPAAAFSAIPTASKGPAATMAQTSGISLPGASLVGAVGNHSAAISAAISGDASGMEAKEGIDTLYLGRRHRGDDGRGRGSSRDASQGPSRRSKGFDASKDMFFIVNDEGVEINGRAAAYYKEVRRMVDQYKGRLDLSESLDVMDDTYSDVWAKLASIEAIANARQIEQHNTHLEETLVWVDGVMKDARGRQIAVHTHQVYFHHSVNPESEIAEGIRRVDKYLVDAERYFARAGKAEEALGKLDEVVLSFDTRGYGEIKAHLKKQEEALARRHGGRFRFAYVDELATVPTETQAVRDALNRLVKKYKGRGLQKIIEGVIYSRYVGVLLELKTIEYFLDRGYSIDQSGRDLFDADGHYITELDTVARAPNGHLSVVEAKSARVALPLEEALQDKVLYKLDTYSKNKALMEAALGGEFDVVFSFDVGRNIELRDFLKSKESALSRLYGFNVSFIFIESAPDAEGQALGRSTPAPRRADDSRRRRRP